MFLFSPIGWLSPKSSSPIRKTNDKIYEFSSSISCHRLWADLSFDILGLTNTATSSSPTLFASLSSASLGELSSQQLTMTLWLTYLLVLWTSTNTKIVFSALPKINFTPHNPILPTSCTRSSVQFAGSLNKWLVLDENDKSSPYCKQTRPTSSWKQLFSESPQRQC